MARTKHLAASFLMCLSFHIGWHLIEGETQAQTTTGSPTWEKRDFKLAQCAAKAEAAENRCLQRFMRNHGVGGASSTP